MSLRRCMEEHTERELECWLAHLDDEFDRPSRTDFYLMQIAAILVQVNSKKGKGVPLSGLRLRFGDGQKRGPASVEQAAAWSKAKWCAAVGMAPVNKEA
jgi:hypothetical protein